MFHVKAVAGLHGEIGLNRYSSDSPSRSISRVAGARMCFKGLEFSYGSSLANTKVLAQVTAYICGITVLKSTCQWEVVLINIISAKHLLVMCMAYKTLGEEGNRNMCLARKANSIHKGCLRVSASLSTHVHGLRV